MFPDFDDLKLTTNSHNTLPPCSKDAVTDTVTWRNSHLEEYFDFFATHGFEEFPNVNLLIPKPPLVTKGGQKIPVTGAGKGKPSEMARSTRTERFVTTPSRTRSKTRALCIRKRFRDDGKTHTNLKDDHKPKSPNPYFDEPLSPILSSSMEPADPCTRYESDSDSDSNDVTFYVPTQKSKILKKAC